MDLVVHDLGKEALRFIVPAALPQQGVDGSGT